MPFSAVEIHKLVKFGLEISPSFLTCSTAGYRGTGLLLPWLGWGALSTGF